MPGVSYLAPGDCLANRCLTGSDRAFDLFCFVELRRRFRRWSAVQANIRIIHTGRHWFALRRRETLAVKLDDWILPRESRPRHLAD